MLQGVTHGKGFVNMSTVDVETATDVCEVSLKLHTFAIKVYSIILCNLCCYFLFELYEYFLKEFK